MALHGIVKSFANSSYGGSLLLRPIYLTNHCNVTNTSSQDVFHIRKGEKEITLSMDNDYVIVYTDGSCLNNGKPDAKAGIGVWFGVNNPLNVSKPVRGRPTNNTAEIQACVAALKIAKKYEIQKLKIVTDSQFLINAVTRWMSTWKTNKWITTNGSVVKNKADFVKLDKCLQCLDIKLEHVKSHSGIKGNEEANKCAQAGALKYKSKTLKSTNQILDCLRISDIDNKG